MSKTKGLWTPIQGTIQDVSVLNTGSGSTPQMLANPDRNYLAINNPNAFSIGISFTGNSAVVGQPGTLTLTAGSSLIFENGYVPTGAFALCGSSGGGVTIWQG